MVALPGQLFYSTQIPVCLWFLARAKKNSRFRDRRGQTLFIDARELGTMADRVHRGLTEADVAKIAGTYHAWRGDKDAGDYSGGVPDLDAELACASDEEARLQTGANSTDPERTPIPGESAPRETARAFFTAPRDVARLVQATLCTVQRRLGTCLGHPATLSDALDAMLKHCLEAWGLRDPKLERVCAWHHQRALHHDRVIRVVGRKRTRFELGVRRGQAPLAVYAKGDVLLSG